VGSWIEFAVDWVVAQVLDWGYGGIFVMMAVESSFVPFPSEVALIPAGYLASKGEMSAVLAIGAGVLGSLVGASINYALALWLGRPFIDRIARIIPGTEGAFAASERFFRSHGEISTFVGRLIPGIRQLISLPAGLARMSPLRFGLYTFLGAGLWSAILVAVGWWAGSAEETWRPLLREATLWLLGGAAVIVAVYVWIHRWAGRIA
jgi:membrane protein DedA with SNARE-associated domain